MFLLHRRRALGLLLPALFSPGERIGFLPAAQGLLGRDFGACQLLGGAGGRAPVQLSSRSLGAPPPSPQNGCLQGRGELPGHLQGAA